MILGLGGVYVLISSFNDDDDDSDDDGEKYLFNYEYVRAGTVSYTHLTLPTTPYV